MLLKNIGKTIIQGVVARCPVTFAGYTITSVGYGDIGPANIVERTGWNHNTIGDLRKTY